MYFLSPAETSAALTSMVWTLLCADEVVPCGSCCNGGCCAGPGCSPVARSAMAGVKSNATNMAAINRVFIRANVEVPGAPGILSCRSRHWEANTGLPRAPTRRRSQFDRSQPQCVCDHRNGAEAHGGARDHRAEENSEEGTERAGGDGHAERVVDKREKEILPDIPHHSSTNVHGFYNSDQVAFHECDTCALDRDIGSCAHGDSDIGGGQGRRIVDTIPSHRDDGAFRFKFSNDIDLFIWHHFGAELVDAQFARNRFGRSTIVARAHDYLQVHLVKLANRFFRRGFGWISTAENA